MWRVSQNYLVGSDEYVYQVYKIRNQNEIDYCGNREWDKNVYITESEAQSRADELNKKAVGEIWKEVLIIWQGQQA